MVSWPGIVLTHSWPLTVQCAEPKDWPAGFILADLAWLSSSGGLQAANWEVERQAFDEKQQELRRQCTRMRRERDELDRLLHAEKSKVACLPQQLWHGLESAGAHQLNQAAATSGRIPQRKVCCSRNAARWIVGAVSCEG